MCDIYAPLLFITQNQFFGGLMKHSLCFVSLLVFIVLSTSAQPPKQYDLRDHDRVTPVKSQKSGTCWCHGTMSGIEGDLLVTGNWRKFGESGEPNMAEYHLSWYSGFAQAWNYDLYPNVEDPNAVPDHYGGDYKIFAAYMSRLDGPIREKDAPGDKERRIPTKAQCPLTKSTYRRWYVPDINWYFIDGDGAHGDCKHIDTIKNALMTSGVMPTNYCVKRNPNTFDYRCNKDNKVFQYQKQSYNHEANHSVAIVGWDDDVYGRKSGTQDTPKGAWLVKNSWGTSQNFFWISYFDKHCCRNAEMSVVSFHNVIPLPYTNVYYHDYHGWRDTLSNSKEAFNKFVARNNTDEYLVAVSFITTIDDEEYEVKVFDKFNNGELSEELATVSGTITHMGYHTRDLNKPVTLKNGDDFYIQLTFKKGFQAYDRTCSPPVLTINKPKAAPIVRSKAGADQSYYRTSASGEWKDLYQYQESIVVDGNTVDVTGTQNFCIKGFVIDTMPVGIQGHQNMLPNTPFKMQNFPNPFASFTTIKYSLNQKSRVTLAIYSAKGRLVSSLVDAQKRAGSHRVSWNAQDVSSGVYYAMLTVSSPKGSITEKRRMFVVK